MNRVNTSHFELVYSSLKRGQKEAVDAIQGAVLVVAGPGTGKTQVLSLRIANILLKTDTYPGSILCLTFTESGVAAMRQRLYSFIGNDAYKVKIHTFHSFCNEIIQNNPETFLFKKAATQLDDLNAIKILSTIIDDLEINRIENLNDKYKLIPSYDKYAYRKEIRDAIKKIKSEGIEETEFEKIAIQNYEEIKNNPTFNKKGNPDSNWEDSLKKAEKNLELSQIYKKYQNYLYENGFYDYEDMIIKVIEEFEKNEKFLSFYQERYLYILVDEYQDTNGAQNKIIRSLGSFDDNPNIFAVGDDDQSIYKFQGANLSNILEFKSFFPEAKIITLNDNFRSSQTILDASYKMIQDNTNRLENVIPDISKKLSRHTTSEVKEEKIKYYKFQDTIAENEFITKKIQELRKLNVSYKDIAIFYRNHKDASDIAEYLIKNNIPVKLFAGDNVLNEKIVVDFVNLLSLVNYNGVSKNSDLFMVLTSSFLQVSDIDIFRITKFFNDISLGKIERTDLYSQNLKNLSKKILNRDSDFFELLFSQEILTELKIIEIEKFISLKNNILKWIKLKFSEQLINLCITIASESGFTEFLGSRSVNIEDKNSFLSFIEYIRQQNSINQNLTLDQFLNDLEFSSENNLSISKRELDMDKDAINMMTVHKSKGLEFLHVFLVKFSENSWFSKGNTKKIMLPNQVYGIHDTAETKDEEEIKRLFYVALTRAKQSIYITYSEIVENIEKKENPLIYLIPSEFLEICDTSIYEIDTNEIILKSLQPVKKVLISEKDFLTQITKDLRISASTLNSFIECPLQFLYSRIIGVPSLPQKSLIIGDAIHKAIEQLNKSFKLNKDTKVSELNEVIKQHINEQVIIENLKKEYISDTINILENFLELELSQNQNKIAEVEYNFYFKDIFLSFNDIKPVFLSGKIDKIEYIDLQTNTVRIVDYKTGRSKTRNEILGLTKASKGKENEFRQLVFYKLLLTLDQSQNPQIGNKYKVLEAQIKYVQTENKKIISHIFEISENNITELKNLIYKVTKAIRNGEFFGEGEFKTCGECEYCKRYMT